MPQSGSVRSAFVSGTGSRRPAPPGTAGERTGETWGRGARSARGPGLGGTGGSGAGPGRASGRAGPQPREVRGGPELRADSGCSGAALRPAVPWGSSRSPRPWLPALPAVVRGNSGNAPLPQLQVVLSPCLGFQGALSGFLPNLRPRAEGGSVPVLLGTHGRAVRRGPGCAEGSQRGSGPRSCGCPALGWAVCGRVLLQ